MSDVMRSKRVHELVAELQELGVAAEDVNFLMRERGTREITDGLALLTPSVDAMTRQIERLFAEAPKLENGDGSPVEGQAPAVECFVVVRGLPTAINGVLSRVDGLLRMLTPTEITDPATRRPKRVFSEQFFRVEDVVCIAMMRDITAGSTIVSS